MGKIQIRSDFLILMCQKSTFNYHNSICSLHFHFDIIQLQHEPQKKTLYSKMFWCLCLNVGIEKRAK